MAKKILCVLIVLCTVFTAVEISVSAASRIRSSRTASATTASTTASSTNSINQITVGGDNTATLTASSIYGAAFAYRKNTSASRWTKTTASNNTYGGVIANYDVYSVVMADLESRYPLAEGYTYSSINIVATATISAKATNATAYNAVSVYYSSAAQSAPSTAYKSSMYKTAFTFKNVNNANGTISVPAVSQANPYLVVYAASSVNSIALYAPTVSISYSYTAAISKVDTNKDATAETKAPADTSSSTTSASTTTTTTQAPIIPTTKAPTTNNTTKKSFLSGWCPWL